MHVCVVVVVVVMLCNGRAEAHLWGTGAWCFPGQAGQAEGGAGGLLDNSNQQL